MKKIVIIIPYFGILPEYFELWKKSVKYNEKIDFLMFTDNNIDNCPKNLKVINTTFENIKKQIQSKFKFKINLNKPYDLSTYKPAYGYIFNEYIKGYDFWGYCDIDLIFGNICNFITDEILNEYEKILSHGHLTLYKNCKKMNELFMTKRKDCIYYKEAFSSSITWNNFDEYPYGVARIAKMEKIKVYENMIFADLDMFSFTFRKVASYFENEEDDNEQIIQYFKWKDGKLFDIIIENNKNIEKEIIYVHLQKRKMQFNQKEKIGNEFLIVPNKFVPCEITQKDILQICDINKNSKYLLEKKEEISQKEDKTPILKKVFSLSRIKRKAFLIKMKKIYKIEPYKFNRGGF